MEFMKMICAKGNIIKNTKEEVGKKNNLPRNAFIFNVFFYNTAQQSQLKRVKRDGKQKKKKTMLEHSSSRSEKKKRK